MTPFRHLARTLPVADPERYRLAVLADTHGRPHPAALHRIAAEAPDAVLHAGDVGAPALLDELAAIAPTVAVRGNVDGRDDGLPDAVTLTLRGADGPLLVVYLTHVALHGVRLLRQPRARAVAAGAGLVVCGHSHVPLIGRDGALALFNPGSCGPRRFRLPILFGVIDLGPAGVTLRHVSCETGERWTPRPPTDRARAAAAARPGPLR